MRRHVLREARPCGGIAPVSLSDESLEAWEPSHDLTPDRNISIGWVNEMLDQAISLLRSETTGETWSVIESDLLEDRSHAPAAPRPGRLRVAVHRARQRLGRILAHDILRATSPRAAASELFDAMTCLRAA